MHAHIEHGSRAIVQPALTAWPSLQKLEIALFMRPVFMLLETNPPRFLHLVYDLSLMHTSANSVATIDVYPETTIKRPVSERQQISDFKKTNAVS